MNDAYIEVISLTERLHRRFLEVVKLELEGLRLHDINNVQALILFHIDEAEMTVGGGTACFSLTRARRDFLARRTAALR